MQNIFINKSGAAALLIVVGLIGLIFGSFFLGIASIVLIILGIYNIYKKTFDSGVIILLIGIGLIFASRFLNAIIRYISMGCIIVGIVLFLIYVIGKKD
jgi:hypothetical protein